MELVERDLALAFHRTLSVSAFSLAGFAGSVEFHFVIIPLFPHSTVSKRCCSRCALLLSCRGLLLARRCAPAPQARRVHTSGERSNEALCPRSTLLSAGILATSLPKEDSSIMSSCPSQF